LPFLLFDAWTQSPNLRTSSSGLRLPCGVARAAAGAPGKAPCGVARAGAGAPGKGADGNVGSEADPVSGTSGANHGQSRQSCRAVGRRAGSHCNAALATSHATPRSADPATGMGSLAVPVMLASASCANHRAPCPYGGGPKTATRWASVSSFVLPGAKYSAAISS
jgi:hypothetical protein